ncbi:MAG: flagellar biosynthesis protein FlhB [Candidatus Hydrogenedentota bacterium]|nr:MAG: flagellar biosynthesis protein FlhB [Candidatus Hydrogenedentota bacterium]
MNGRVRQIADFIMPFSFPPLFGKGLLVRGRESGEGRGKYRAAAGRLYFDLQMFAAEDEGRTEDPTNKKISKAREQGQVAKSQEVNQIVTLFMGCLIGFLVFPRVVMKEVDHLRYFFENLGTLELTDGSLRTLILENILHLLNVIWPVILVQVIVAIGINVLQVGWLFTWNPLKPKLNKIFPQPKKLIDRLVIGKTVLFNLFKSFLKVVGCGFIAYLVLKKNLPQLLTLWKLMPYPVTATILKIAFELLWKISVLLGILALADYAYSRYQWKDSLKMTKQEVKDERRQSEGDPEIKKAQRRRMMEVVRRRMMREIPTADVVITNPTHYAVAIKYDNATMQAPTVVAKGEGFLAIKIRQIAEENGVPVVENKPLAQALYRGVEIGSEIPPQFYQAVAEVLAYVYRMKRKAS